MPSGSREYATLDQPGRNFTIQSLLCKLADMRRRAGAALAVLLAVMVVASGAVWLVSTKSVHEDAEAVPSTVAVAHSDRYRSSLEESRRLARALVAGDNLPGLGGRRRPWRDRLGRSLRLGRHG
jgi:hypothetical protein